MNDDASTYDFGKLGITLNPIFFVSGLPEMGEMFIDNLMQTTMQNKFEHLVSCF